MKSNFVLLKVSFCRREDVESKYYADGEDAYAMKRSLTALAEVVKKEDEARKRRSRQQQVAEQKL